jgi:hypothetical protein
MSGLWTPRKTKAGFPQRPQPLEIAKGSDSHISTASTTAVPQKQHQKAEERRLSNWGETNTFLQAHPSMRKCLSPEMRALTNAGK